MFVWWKPLHLPIFRQFGNGAGWCDVQQKMPTQVMFSTSQLKSWRKSVPSELECAIMKAIWPCLCATTRRFSPRMRVKGGILVQKPPGKRMDDELRLLPPPLRFILWVMGVEPSTWEVQSELHCSSTSPAEVLPPRTAMRILTYQIIWPTRLFSIFQKS
jgi:hypothetical protein